MPFFCRPDKIIVRNVEAFPQILEQCYDAIDVFERRHAFGFGSALYFLAVFIGTGKEKYVIAAQTMETRQGIGNGRAIRMADMQLGTGIVNGGGNKILFLLCHDKSSSAGK